jgi:hypothetical protein
MPLPQAQIIRYPVQVLTTAFYIEGGLEPIGPIINFLNDKDRQFFVFLDATVTPLTPGPMGAVTRSQIIVPKKDVIALYLDGPNVRSNVQLLRRVERCIMYLPPFVCRGEFHLGEDTRWADMLSLLAGDFFGVTSASMFPLSALPGKFPQQADIVFLNRLFVGVLHLDQP